MGESNFGLRNADFGFFNRKDAKNAKGREVRIQESGAKIPSPRMLSGSPGTGSRPRGNREGLG